MTHTQTDTEKENWLNFGFTSLCSSDINEPDISRSTSNMSLKDTFPLQSESYTLKITGKKKMLMLGQQPNMFISFESR